MIARRLDGLLQKYSINHELRLLRAQMAVAMDDREAGVFAAQMLIILGLVENPTPAARPIVLALNRKDWIAPAEAIISKRKAAEEAKRREDEKIAQEKAAAEALRRASAEVDRARPMRRSTATESPSPGLPLLIADLDLMLVPIRPGGFPYYSQTITLTKPYWLGETEVTQAQWKALMGSAPSYFKGAQRPVESISWKQAMDFCNKLTKRERKAGRLPPGYSYTLPTEAQWEYACRAGTTGDYAGNLDDLAWYDKNSGRQTQPVATKQPNTWGLYDMHGNVWEWCLDWDSWRGWSNVTTDPVGPPKGSFRVGRSGGCFRSADDCRSANRGGFVPGSRGKDFGFRVALSTVQ